MAKKIQIDVKVDDKGTTKKLGLGAKEASKGIDNVGKSAKDTEKNMKGMAGTASAGSKNFGKMAQGAGGLVAAYASVAATIFAVSAAFGFLKRAGDLVALQRGQEQYAIKTGKSMKLLTSRLQEATGGLLGFDEASQAAAIGTAAGLSSDQLSGLARIAKNASVALGRDLTDSFNRLTRGAIKAEPELLDELGIILRLEKASKDYALALDKDVNSLTMFEKSQAVVNAVLQQGVEKFDDVGSNVNQIARLGKKFDDLVKQISRFIEPLATFLSSTLADNVNALAAAFTVLGLSITRALIPAGPAMAGFASTVAASKAALMGAAGPAGGANADAIRAGNIGPGQLAAIDRGAGADTSTVINKKSEVNFKKHTMILRADHQRMIAANSTGMKKYAANFKMQLAIMQAEHGKTMGAMKMAGATFASGLNKAMSAVAILGMLAVALAMMKALINYFKDPAIRALEENAKLVKERFKEQNVEIARLSDGFENAANGATNLVKQANMLSNFSFQGVEGMTKALENAKTKTQGEGNSIRTVVDESSTNSSILEGTSAVIDSLRIQSTVLADFGKETTKEYQENVNKLIVAQNTITKGATPGNLTEYNAALDVQRDLLAETAEMGTFYANSLNASKAAINSLSETSEGFLQLRESAKHASSSYSSFIGFNDKLLESLNTVKEDFTGDESMLSYFGADKIGAFKNVLGDAVNTMTAAQAITAITTLNADIRAKEFAIQIKSLQTQKQFIAGIRNKSKLQVAELTRENAISKAKDAILKLEQKIAYQDTLGAGKDSTKTQELNAQLDILKEQLITAKDMNNEVLQLVSSFKNGFESSMTTNIADLIKGKESSLKDAMMKIAQGAIEAVANKLSEQISLSVTDFIFGKDPKIVAEEENTAAIKANTAALTGVSVPGAAGGGLTPTSVNANGKGFFSTLLTGSGNNPNPGTALQNAGTKSLGDVNPNANNTNGILDEITTTGNRSGGLKGIFDGFTANMADMFTGETPFLTGLGNIFKDGAADFGSLFSDLLGGLFGGSGGGGGGGFMEGILGMFGLGARSGGVFSAGKKIQGYATGGIARGSTSGYPATLHGTEAVVPLPHGGKIPVEMKGEGSTNNNIVVNVSTDGQSSKQGSTGPDMDKLGGAIATAVQVELQNQKRSGGILNPYGVA